MLERKHPIEEVGTLAHFVNNMYLNESSSVCINQSLSLFNYRNQSLYLIHALSYRVPEDDLSVVPGRAASGQEHLQPSDVQNLSGPVGLIAGHLQEQYRHYQKGILFCFHEETQSDKEQTNYTPVKSFQFVGPGLGPVCLCTRPPACCHRC